MINNQTPNREIFKLETELAKQQKTSKLSSNFNPRPYVVTETNGTKITAENETSGHRITRNVLNRYQ